jgi:eukaryotic-like serine/threonine-protein kinase
MICDDTNLLALLEADEDDVTIQEIAEHVDECETCRRRLDDFSQSEFSRGEQDVRELLSDVDEDQLLQSTSIVIAIDSSLPESLAAECTELALDFLEPPSHPETLGRLGRYEIERLIGNGGMGIVLKGFDTELHRPVAIKLLAPHLAHSGAARQRFAREGQAAAAVVHEHVLPIHNVESHNSVPYLVMPFVHGRSLQARVDEDGPLPVGEALRIGRQMPR